MEVDFLNEMIKTTPILTIGVPTCNREMYIHKCLESIYSQIGNDSRFEVLICDNDSSDNTKEIVNIYATKYTNIVYVKNDTNIGASKNIQKVLELATGEYIHLQGDDDYVQQGVYYETLNMISNNRDCDVMFLKFLPSFSASKVFSVKRGVGLRNFIVDANNISGINGILIKNAAYKNINDKEKFLYSSLNHMYIQLEMLHNNPNYCVLDGPIARFDCASAGFSGYNVMEVIMKNYIDILYSFEGNGLTTAEIKYQKYFLLFLLLPFIRWVINANMSLSLDNSIELFTEYYSGEAYFEEKLLELKSILALKITSR